MAERSAGAVPDGLPSPPPARVALVTGAGSGIGAEVAVALAEAGLAVGLVGRTVATLERTAARCRAGGGAVVTAVADVVDPAAVAVALAVVEGGVGPVDLLVSNAGVVDDGEVPLGSADLDDVWRVVVTNVRGPLVLARAVLPGMVARGGGRIVHVNSGFSARVGPGYTGYAVSKGALARLTAMLAHQYAGSGVVVLDVSPGLVRTAMTLAMPMWSGRATPPWGSVAPMQAVVRAVAAGRLDALSGRFVHAQQDDLDALVARAPQIVAADARVLRLAPYGLEDPLA